MGGEVAGGSTTLTSLKRTTAAAETSVGGEEPPSVNRAAMGHTNASDTGRLVGGSLAGGDDGVYLSGAVADELARSMGGGSDVRKKCFLRG